jgi:hypothetical protein
MSAESLSLIAGSVLSLLFSYIPGVRAWFMPLDPQVKRLLMLGLIILSASTIFGLACLGWGAELGITLVCSQKGLVNLVRQVVLAIIANQGIYAISPRAVPHNQGDRDPAENVNQEASK